MATQEQYQQQQHGMMGPNDMMGPQMTPPDGMPMNLMSRVKQEAGDWSNPAYQQQQQQQMAMHMNGQMQHGGNMVPEPKAKKPRKRKKKDEETNGNDVVDGVKVKQEPITNAMPVKKKRDRFKGMTEEEVLKRVLPDHLVENLDIAIVGINPGLTAAYVGHHYAGPGNHFWKCLFLSGLIPEQMNAYDDSRLRDFGIGFTNIVERTSRGSADLSRKEIKEGGEILTKKIQKYKPKIAVFNGKGIYEVFCGHKNFHIGKQPDHFPDCPETQVFVMPSSSARFTQLPRAIDKVPFYLALKKFRDYLKGDIKEIDEREICFPDLNLKVTPRADREPKPIVKEEPLEGEQPKKKRGRQKKAKTDNDMQADLAMQNMQAAMQGRANMPGMHPGGPNMYDMNQHGPNPGMYPPMPMIKAEPGTYDGQNGPCGPQGQNGEHFPMNNQFPQGPQSNMDALFSSPPNLVKQEDTNELAQFGVMPHLLPQSLNESQNPQQTNSSNPYNYSMANQANMNWSQQNAMYNQSNADMASSQGNGHNMSYQQMQNYNPSMQHPMGQWPNQQWNQQQGQQQQMQPQQMQQQQQQQQHPFDPMQQQQQQQQQQNFNQTSNEKGSPNAQSVQSNANPQNGS